MKTLKKLGAVAVALVMATATILPMVSVDVSADSTGLEGTYNYLYDSQRTESYPDKDENFNISQFKAGLETDNKIEGSWELTEVGTMDDVPSTAPNFTNLGDIVNKIAYEYDVVQSSITIHKITDVSDPNNKKHIAYGVITAYDSVQNILTFIGDTWNVGSGGAGYVLSNSPLTESSYTIKNTIDPAKSTTYYTVTFVVDGKTVGTQRVPQGYDAALNAVPEKSGFTGVWDKDGKNITADTTITAVYTAINTGNSTTQPTAPATPVEKPAAPATDPAPKTGDDSNTALWIALVLLSGAALAGFGVNRKFNVN